jgi:hypothetical protein
MANRPLTAVIEAIEQLASHPGNERAQGKVVRDVYLGHNFFVACLGEKPCIIDGQYSLVEDNTVSLFDLMDMED